MQQVRPTPFDLVFQSTAQTTFPRIQSVLAESGQDPRNRDAFLMLRDVVTLLRELRPEEGLGEGIDQLAALIHHGYLFWSGGNRVMNVSPGQLGDLMREGAADAVEDPEVPAQYVQIPPHRTWASVVPGEAPEPLDGFFQYAERAGWLRVLGVFGMHPERPGFSVVEVAGKRQQGLSRADRSALFAPTLEGGPAAGIYSLVGGEELLELGWRVNQLGAVSSPVPSPGS